MSQQMTDVQARRRELIIGASLLAFALIWTVAVYATVPVGRGEGIGPRAFPLALGMILILLSGLLLVSALRGSVPADETEYERPGANPMPLRLELRIVATVCVILAAYGYLMVTTGFVPATILTVACTLWFALGERRPGIVIGLSLGLAFGCWLVFGHLLGAYMPRGSWLPHLF